MGGDINKRLVFIFGLITFLVGGYFLYHHNFQVNAATPPIEEEAGTGGTGPGETGSPSRTAIVRIEVYTRIEWPRGRSWHHEVPAAKVQLVSSRESKEALTNLSGRAHFEQVKFDQYQLKVEKAGFITHEQQLRIDGNGDYRFYLDRDSSILRSRTILIYGYVSDRNNKPIPAVSVGFKSGNYQNGASSFWILPNERSYYQILIFFDDLIRINGLDPSTTTIQGILEAKGFPYVEVEDPVALTVGFDLQKNFTLESRLECGQAIYYNPVFAPAEGIAYVLAPIELKLVHLDENRQVYNGPFSLDRQLEFFLRPGRYRAQFQSSNVQGEALRIRPATDEFVVGNDCPPERISRRISFIVDWPCLDILGERVCYEIPSGIRKAIEQNDDQIRTKLERMIGHIQSIRTRCGLPRDIPREIFLVKDVVYYLSFANQIVVGAGLLIGLDDLDIKLGTYHEMAHAIYYFRNLDRNAEFQDLFQKISKKYPDLFVEFSEFHYIGYVELVRGGPLVFIGHPEDHPSELFASMAAIMSDRQLDQQFHEHIAGYEGEKRALAEQVHDFVKRNTCYHN